MAGVDRSLATQRQPPWTTPEALNVRPDDSREFRGRGGSRPGLARVGRTTLPGPIRLLTRVARNRTTTPNRADGYLTQQLSKTVQTPTWSQPGETNGSTLWGPDFALKPPPANIPATTAAGYRELSVTVVPHDNLPMEGSVDIFTGLPTPDADPTITSTRARLTFHLQTQAIGGLLTIVNGAQQAIANSAPVAESGKSFGVFSARVYDSGRIAIFWRGQTLLDVYGALTGANFAVQVVSDNSSIAIAEVLHEYQAAGETVERTQRWDQLLAVSAGKLWRETSEYSLEEVPADFELSDGVELTAAPREEQLFIADPGVSLGGVGDVAANLYTRITDNDVDFLAAGVKPGFAVQIAGSTYSANEIIALQLFNVDGGTFTLTFKGSTTAPVNWNATADELTTALETLDTISDVYVTAGVNSWQIMFQGADGGQAQPSFVLDLDGLTDSGGDEPSATQGRYQLGAGSDAVLVGRVINTVGQHTIDFFPALGTGLVGAFTVDYELGNNCKLYDATTGLLTYLEAEKDAAGILKGAPPVGCRLVALYRDRLVLAGADLNPGAVHLSRVGNPHDWDTSQLDAAAAITLGPAQGGQVPDPVTALIPHGDSCLVIGCYNSLWILRGDPGLGGSLDPLSRAIGVVGPHAWTYTPDNTVHFLSADGLYVMPAGCAGMPTSVSREKIPNELLSLSGEREIVTLQYDVLARGVHILVTRYDDSPGAHWWFDFETKGFWQVTLQHDHEPFATHEKLRWNGTPIVLLGGRDGVIRAFHRLAVLDDGDNVVPSQVILGPFHLDGPGFTEGLLAEIQAHLGAESASIDYEVLVGNGHEQAVLAEPRESGTWDRDSMNYNQRPRARGVSCAIRVKGRAASVSHWFLERVTALIRSAGTKRVR